MHLGAWPLTRTSTLVLLLGACAPGAAAGTVGATPVGPVPTAPPSTAPAAPTPADEADVRAAVAASGLGSAPFEVLLVDPTTAVATDDRTWAVAVRRVAGTWQVAEHAPLG